MWTLILKNGSGSDKIIEDLGITIIDTTQITASDQFTYPQLAESDDLRTLVNNGDLVVNDGSGDLSAARGVEYLVVYNQDQAKRDFYTKTNVQTDGEASVHWNNITNVPAFGAADWIDPVEAKITEQTATPPGSPSDGDFYIDTDDDHLWKYIVDTWTDQGAPTAGDRVIDLSSATENIFEWSGSSWDDTITPTDAMGVLVKDDGDGKQAQYVYDLTATTWIKIADVDFGEPNSLGNAYNEGGAGAGRVIDAISGAVKVDTGAATTSPLELTEKAALPTTGLAAGQVAVKGGILFVYDGTRSKWLSVERLYLVFGRKGQTAAQYLDFGAGGLPSNNSGLRIPRDACVVAMSGQLDTAGTVNFRLRSNDNTSSVATLALGTVAGAHDTTLNVNISAGDFLQLYSDNASNVEDPMVVVEIAYRA